MQKLSANVRAHKFIITGGIVGCLAILIAVIYFFSFYQISPAHAQKACQKFSNDIKEQITAVKGYTVIGERKSCIGSKDEMGATDYILSAEFRVSKNDIDSATASKSSINHLASNIPRKNYSVWIDNVPAKNGQPPTICVSASKYLNNNGMNTTQGPPGVYPRYTEPGSIQGFSPCEDL